MLQVYCAAHGSRVLLSTSRITALRNCPDGVVIEWRCWCGHQGRSSENLHAHRDVDVDGSVAVVGSVEAQGDGDAVDPAGTWPAAS